MVEIYDHLKELHKNSIFLRFELLNGSTTHHAIEPDPKGKPFKWRSIEAPSISFDFSIHGKTNLERQAPLSKLFFIKIPGREMAPLFNSEGQFTFSRYILPSGESRMMQRGNYMDDYLPKVGDYLGTLTDNDTLILTPIIGINNIEDIASAIYPEMYGDIEWLKEHHDMDFSTWKMLWFHNSAGELNYYVWEKEVKDQEWPWLLPNYSII